MQPTSVMVDRIIELPQYNPGKVLRLAPYTPPEAYGRTSLVAKPPVSRKPLTPPNFVDKVDPPTLASIEVVNSLSGGIAKEGAQVLLCKIRSRPESFDKTKHARFPGHPSRVSVVVAKVFDPVLYSGERVLDPNYVGDTVASRDISREASVFQFCYEKNMTGHPNFVPQYYDSVSLILMEYVEGRTIEQLCTRHKTTGFLVPMPGPVALHQDPEAERLGTLKKFDTSDRKLRLDILALVLKGIVAHIHKLVQHDEVKPENLIITYRNHGVDLDKPHVYLLDFNLSSIWSATKEGRGDPSNEILSLSHPPHPWLRSSIEGLVRFIGWFPERWTNDDYTSWTVRQFGPRTGFNPNYFTFSAEYDQYMPPVEEYQYQLLVPDPEAQHVLQAVAPQAVNPEGMADRSRGARRESLPTREGQPPSTPQRPSDQGSQMSGSQRGKGRH